MEKIDFLPSMVLALQANKLTVFRVPIQNLLRYMIISGIEKIDNKNFIAHDKDFNIKRKITLKYPVNDIIYVAEPWTMFNQSYLYKANFSKQDLQENYKSLNWQSANTMPLSAARFYLKVKSVKIERLFDITAVSAKKEGFISQPFKPKDIYYELRERWSKLGHKGPYAFFHNPYVWVVEIERITKKEIKRYE